ncbi:PLDc N-terminal domain-containing protein [Actinophytocola oryzae]
MAAVRGRKPLWAFVIAVNFVGPITYLCVGRRRGGCGSHPDGAEGPVS